MNGMIILMNTKIIYIFLLILIVNVSLFSQSNRGNGRGKVNTNKQSVDAARILRYKKYAKSAKNRGDNLTAYSHYKRVLEMQDNDLAILDDFIAVAIAIKKIKECETYLKSLQQKYPLLIDSENFDKSKKNYPLLLKSRLAYFFMSTERIRQGEVIIDQISSLPIDAVYRSELIAEIYVKSGDVDYAVSYLLKARKNNGNPYLFSKTLFGIYKEKFEFVKAASELLYYILLTQQQKDISPLLQKQEIERGELEFIKLFELVNDEEKEKIVTSILTLAEEFNYFYSLLSELYFKEKKYDLSFKYLKKSDYGNEKGGYNYPLLRFAGELYNEGEYEFARSYFELFYQNNPGKRKSSKELQLYLDVLIRTGYADNAVVLLTDILSGSKDQKLELFLANIYQYQVLKPALAEKIYLKYKGKSSRLALTASFHYFKLLLSSRRFDETKELVQSINGSRYLRRSPALYDEFAYLLVVLPLLQGNMEEFQKRSNTFFSKKRVNDYENNLLQIKSNLAIVKDDKSLFLLYVDFLLREISPSLEIDHNDFKLLERLEGDKKIFVIKLNYYYLKSKKNSGKELEAFVNKLLSEKYFELGNLDDILLDYVKINSENKKHRLLSGKILKIFVTKYKESVFYDEARVLLRECKKNNGLLK